MRVKYVSLFGLLTLSEPVYRTITETLGHNPIWAERLSQLIQPWEEVPGVWLVRVFDETIVAEDGVDRVAFEFLDNRPELVIFEGWFDETTGKVWLM